MEGNDGIARHGIACHGIARHANSPVTDSPVMQNSPVMHSSPVTDSPVTNTTRPSRNHYDGRVRLTGDLCMTGDFLTGDLCMTGGSAGPRVPRPEGALPSGFEAVVIRVGREHCSRVHEHVFTLTVHGTCSDLNTV